MSITTILVSLLLAQKMRKRPKYVQSSSILNSKMAAKGTSTSNFLCDFIVKFGIINIMNIAILKSKIGTKGKGPVTF